MKTFVRSQILTETTEIAWLQPINRTFAGLFPQFAGNTHSRGVGVGLGGDERAQGNRRGD